MRPTTLTGAAGDTAHSWEYRMRRGRNWFFIGLLYAGYYVCRYNLSPILAKMAEDLQLDNKQLGSISSGRDIGYAIGTFVNGLLSDRLGGRVAMTVGAIGTIVLNLAFGWVTTLAFTGLLGALIAIRTVDGYLQSFGSPGMVRMNASWFMRRERGQFAGVFGVMIQLGQITANWLPIVLTTGIVAFFGFTLLEFKPLGWRSMLVVPPSILGVLLLLFWTNVKAHPEDAGFIVAHEDDEFSASPHERLPLWTVFITIASTPLVWVNGLAYMCTGFVRRGYDVWWAKYMHDAWHVDIGSKLFFHLGWMLVVAAVIGSMASGYISDRFFKSKRAPVAALLYGIETIVIITGGLLLATPAIASAQLAAAVLVMVSLTCNSSHSVIGAAAAMDIGGRKMTGFALGIINSFQYIGATLAGYALGGYIDHFGWDKYLYAMAPFSLLGTVLMTWVAIATRGRHVRGS